MRCESAQNRPLEPLYPLVYVDCLEGIRAGKSAREQQSDLPGLRRGYAGTKGVIGDGDVPKRGGEILALGLRLH